MLRSEWSPRRRGPPTLRAVSGPPRHRPAMNEGPAQRHHHIAADPTVGGFQPNDAAVGGRPSDRAAGARAERAHAQTGSHSSARAAAGAPWDMLEVPGIARQG